MRRFRRTKSECSKCPLDGRTKVWGAYDFDVTPLVLIGEAPGREEELAETGLDGGTGPDLGKREKGPFVGPAGRMLRHALGQAGVPFQATYRTNAICCRPPGNDIASDEGAAAVERCRKGFEEELDFLGKHGARVLVPLGGTALHALGIDGAVSRRRGSVHLVPGRKDLVALPSYHPSFILRGASREEPVWIADLRKAKELSLKEYVPLEEDFEMFPTIQSLRKLVDSCVKDGSLVSVDIETSGGFDPGRNRILVIGFGLSSTKAFSVPFLKKGGERYWPSLEEEIEAKALAQRVLGSNPLMFQNALFDVRQLETKGFRIKDIRHDTMLLHHSIHPELAHDLGYIVSVYGKTANWKEEVRSSKDRMADMEDRALREYNLRDCVVLHQVLSPMLEDLEEVGTDSTYSLEMSLVRPLLSMTSNGLLLDQKAVSAMRSRLERESRELEERMRKDNGLPPSFNFDSPQHLNWILHGRVPDSVLKAKEAFEEYQKDPKRRKDTKKFREIERTAGLFDQVRPFPKTSSSSRNSDIEALQSVQQAANNRLSELKGMKRRNPGHSIEAEGLEGLLRFISLYLEWNEKSKYLTSFTKYPVGSDGRVHGSYKIHGTSTGRLSASEPNLQQQPKDVRSVFVSEEGWSLIQADYSNLELRVLAYLTEEPYLVDAFKKGVKIHKANCQALFGIPEDHPDYDLFYRAAKVFVFGRNYGGGLQGIYRRILSQVPGFRMGFEEFKRVDSAYFSKMVKYSDWMNRVKDLVSGRAKGEEDWGGYRWMANAFGRKRFFLGTPEEIEREALNTPIQGTAADIANTSLVLLHSRLEEAKDLQARILTMVHDSILVEAKDRDVDRVAKLVKGCMERPFRINGKDRVFPVDVEVGKNWGKLEKWGGKDVKGGGDLRSGEHAGGIQDSAGAVRGKDVGRRKVGP